jgi:hypothetical protein
MEYNRVDAKKFQHAVTESLKELESVDARLGRFMRMLTPAERKRYVKGRTEVLAAAPGPARLSRGLWRNPPERGLSHQ